MGFFPSLECSRLTFAVLFIEVTVELMNNGRTIRLPCARRAWPVAQAWAQPARGRPARLHRCHAKCLHFQPLAVVASCKRTACPRSAL